MQPIWRVCRSTQAGGFSLVELVIVIGVLAVLSVLAMERIPGLGAMTAASQAEKFANDLRYAQTLAYTSGQPVLFNTSTSGYDVVPLCNLSLNLPCATGFSVALERSVELSAASSVRFSSLGVANVDASYSLGGIGISLNALTGRICTPPCP